MEHILSQALFWALAVNFESGNPHGPLQISQDNFHFMDKGTIVSRGWNPTQATHDYECVPRNILVEDAFAWMLIPLHDFLGNSF